MKTLKLTLEESRELKETGSVEIVRNGFDMLVEVSEDTECGYWVTIINPYEKVILAKEPKETPKEAPKKKTILVANFDPKKMHVYDVKTTGKHPVRLIEGGEWITEYEGEDINDCYDMGWYWLNQKEYDYFKSQLIEVELDDNGEVKVL